MKRIKKVFTNADQVLHLWANQAQSDARCGNVFFEGRSCYSYGTHYELGRLVEHNGQTVAMINGEGYSNTTSKHIHKAAAAASHLPCFVSKSGNVDNVAEAMIERQDALLVDLFGHFAKRNPYQDFERADSYGIAQDVDSFNALCSKLGFEKLRLEIGQDFVELFNGHTKACKERREELRALKNSPEAIAKLEAAKARKEELELEKAAGEIKAWRDGGRLTEAVRRGRLNLLRINGETVETSGGAEVPLSHALKLLALIEKGQAKKGAKVGHFSLDAVNEETVSIGCHQIALSEARAVLAGAKPRLSIVSKEEVNHESI